GHSDYVEYEDNSIAILCTVNARVNANGSSFKRNEVAISSRFGGVVYVPSNVQLHTGTADANTDNFRRNGGQILLDSDNEIYFQDYETVYLDTSSHVITGSTTTQLACSYPVAANLLTSNPNNIYKGKALRIRASGV